MSQKNLPVPHWPDVLHGLPIAHKDLLPTDAQTVIGKPHPGAEPALALLRAQGFRLNNVVDIFDAGPSVEAFVDQIEIVRTAVRMSAAEFGEFVGSEYHRIGAIMKAAGLKAQ